MIDHLGLGRLAVLMVAALVVFGPERLPELAAQLGRGLRQFRGMLDNMSAEVKASIGPELSDLDLQSLHPKTFIASLMEADAVPAEAAPVAEATRPPELGDKVYGSATIEAVVPASEPLHVGFEQPVGTDAMTLLHRPLDLEGLTAPWD